MPSTGFSLPTGESSVCIVSALGVFLMGSVRDPVLERDRGLVGDIKLVLGLSRELGLIAQGLSFPFWLQRLRLERILTVLGCFPVVGVLQALAVVPLEDRGFRVGLITVNGPEQMLLESSNLLLKLLNDFLFEAGVSSMPSLSDSSLQSKMHDRSSRICSDKDSSLKMDTSS